MVAPRQWSVYATSVAGHSHTANDLPCQDASDARSLDEAKWAWAIVADGHGSDRCFRSDRGARLAVAVLGQAFASVQALAASEAERGIATVPTSRWVDWAATRVVGQWREAVARDLLADPPVVDREPMLGRWLEGVKVRSGWAAASRAVRQVEAFQVFAQDARQHVSEGGPLALRELPGWDDDLGSWQVTAYGCTLLGVLAAPDALHWFQLGDGAMIKITGGVADYLEPPPAEAIANETPSLSSSDAVRAATVGTVHLAAGDVPSTLILTTDGIPNSYESHEGFLQFCTEIGARVYEEGTLQQQMPVWLPEISRKGSGDDMSIAIVYSSEVDPPAVQPPSGSESVKVIVDQVDDDDVDDQGSQPSSEVPGVVGESAEVTDDVLPHDGAAPPSGPPERGELVPSNESSGDGGITGPAYEQVISATVNAGEGDHAAEPGDDDVDGASERDQPDSASDLGERGGELPVDEGGSGAGAIDQHRRPFFGRLMSSHRRTDSGGDSC